MLFASAQLQKQVWLYGVQLMLSLSQSSIEFAPVKGVSVVIENRAMGDQELVEIDDSASEIGLVLEKSVANNELISRNDRQARLFAIQRFRLVDQLFVSFGSAERIAGLQFGTSLS